MKITNRILLLFIALAVAAGIGANADEALKREMRAAWIATVYRIDWPTSVNNPSAQKNELNAYLDNLQAQNINAIFLQVRTMCDAFYQSSYEPWSSYLTGTRGKDPGYDPLQYAVEQCHARGIQCHAWVNPYRWSTGTNWNTPQDQALINAGMLLSYTSGSTTTTILNPGLPATRERIVNVIREIITKYDVDGVVFDDYFYPSGIPANSSAADYNLWNDSGVDMTFADWRRNNVNMMVRDVYNMIQDVKPEVRFGISPAGVAGTAATSAGLHDVTPCPTGSDWQYNGIFSDPLAWLEQGTIDYISPQLYWKTNHSTNPFGPLTKWWSYIANHYGRHHYASHSISFLAEGSNNTTSSWAEIAQQISYSRQYTENDAPGAVLYSAKNINGNNGGVGGLGNYLFNNMFQHPALIPAVTWKTAPGYDAPANLEMNGNTLEWAQREGTLVKYSVYAVPSDITVEQAMSTAFDGIKSDYLIAITYKPQYTLPSAYRGDYWYAVCNIDGYGNESEPAILGDTPGPSTEISYSIEKVWELPNLGFFSSTGDVRQGFGMNGKFYINDKSTSTIYEVGRTGLTGVALEGGANCGLSRDEAGNLVVSDAHFPNAWTGNPVIKVVNPATEEMNTYTLPASVIGFGRSDNIGFARGNMLEDGELYVVGATSGTNISRIAISGGELDTDNTYLANCDGVTTSNTTVLNYYNDLNGEPAVLYVTRNSPPVKMTFDGEGFVGSSFSLPNKGACNGAFPFVWDGKELVVYPTLDNYRDGFAVAEMNAAEPLVSVPQAATANANDFTNNWLNAEVENQRNVIIYQYYPGGHITVWRLTKHGGPRGDVNDDGTVDISDATTLINYLLNGDATGINMEGANCDLTGGVDISDATTLINYLLNGTWPNE
ncbi:MAG: family 10 glycosylhydrolase [Muribaculaceae bacterium]|nr:family 10 glycosylhydrolase [Muribaculaceae bacterium]